MIFNITECLELGIYGREKDDEELPEPINPIDYENIVISILRLFSYWN